MRYFRVLLSALFLLSCFGGEAIAAAQKGKKASDPQKKTEQQQLDKSDKSDKKDGSGGGFSVKVGKKSSHSDDWTKGSKRKDPF